MHRGSAHRPGDQTTARGLARIGGGVRGERQQREAGGHGPLWGPRAGDRSALTVISLALDEVDATAVLTGAIELASAQPDQPVRARLLPKGSSAAG